MTSTNEKFKAIEEEHERQMSKLCAHIFVTKAAIDTHDTTESSYFDLCQELKDLHDRMDRLTIYFAADVEFLASVSGLN